MDHSSPNPGRPARDHDMEIWGHGRLGVDLQEPPEVEYLTVMEECDGSPVHPFGWWSLLLWLKPCADRDSVEAEVRRQTDAWPQHPVLKKALARARAEKRDVA